jgi:hypothetical protein
MSLSEQATQGMFCQGDEARLGDSVASMKLPLRSVHRKAMQELPLLAASQL